MHTPHIITGGSDLELAEQQAGHSVHLRVLPHFRPGYDVEIIEAEGGHGGGDPLLQEQIFSPNPPPEQFGRNAGPEQGAASILIGIAANRSMESGAPVKILDLCDLRPDAQNLNDLV